MNFSIGFANSNSALGRAFNKRNGNLFNETDKKSSWKTVLYSRTFFLRLILLAFVGLTFLAFTLNFAAETNSIIQLTKVRLGVTLKESFKNVDANESGSSSPRQSYSSDGSREIPKLTTQPAAARDRKKDLKSKPRQTKKNSVNKQRINQDHESSGGGIDSSNHALPPSKWELKNKKQPRHTRKNFVNKQRINNEQKVSSGGVHSSNHTLPQSKGVKRKNQRDIATNQIKNIQDDSFPRPCLTFVHITKTGGTAIENLAARYGIAWGLCTFTTKHFFSKPVCLGLPPHGIHYKAFTAPWHDPELQHSCPNTFTIVRNPYTRLVSEFFSKYAGFDSKEAINRTSLNSWIMTRVNRIAENGIWKPGAITYHGVEQYRYVYDKVNSRRITHVLYYENLEDDFNSLMDLYGLPIKYSSKIVNPSPFQRNASAHDLEDETVNRINKIYAKDFKMFGYQPKRELQSWSNYTYDSSFSQKKKKKVMLATTKLKTLSVNSKHSNENPFLCAISRAHNEHEKLDSFIHHNLQEGFDKIVIIDDRSNPPLVSDRKEVEFKRVNLANMIHDKSESQRGREYIQKVISNELSSCTWVSHIDVDEFITTRRQEQLTVRDELKKSFWHANAVLIPWVFYAYVDSKLAKKGNTTDVTLDHLWRWNLDLHHHGNTSKTRDRYKEVEVKTIFRPKYCKLINDHSIACQSQFDSVSIQPIKKMNGRFSDFHEKELSQAFLAINHYRFISDNDILNKCSSDSVLKLYNINNTTKCFLDNKQSNQPQLYDEIMVRKRFGKNSRGAFSPYHSDSPRSVSRNRTKNDCIISIHGFHNSGAPSSKWSGIAQVISYIQNAFPNLTSTIESGKEGQDVQRVYPSFTTRTVDSCASHRKHIFGRGDDLLYTCPKALKSFTADGAQKLLKQWYSKWEYPSKPIKIEKSSTFDIRLLDSMITSSHVILMSHPLQWHNNDVPRSSPLALDIWLRVWNQTLNALKDGDIDRWIIVQYEGLQNSSAMRSWTSNVCSEALEANKEVRKLRNQTIEYQSADIGVDSTGSPFMKETRIENSAAMVMEPILKLWFNYSLSGTPDSFANSTVWASHLNRTSLDNEIFWKQWNSALSQYASKVDFNELKKNLSKEEAR